MTDIDIERTRADLMKFYPGCRVKIAEDRQEMVAEITDEFAVAVIEGSLPHFHLKMREIYRVMRGTLLSLDKSTSREPPANLPGSK